MGKLVSIFFSSICNGVVFCVHCVCRFSSLIVHFPGFEIGSFRCDQHFSTHIFTGIRSTKFQTYVILMQSTIYLLINEFIIILSTHTQKMFAPLPFWFWLMHSMECVVFINTNIFFPPLIPIQCIDELFDYIWAYACVCRCWNDPANTTVSNNVVNDKFKLCLMSHVQMNRMI